MALARIVAKAKVPTKSQLRGWLATGQKNINVPGVGIRSRSTLRRWLNKPDEAKKAVARVNAGRARAAAQAKTKKVISKAKAANKPKKAPAKKSTKAANKTKPAAKKPAQKAAPSKHILKARLYRSQPLRVVGQHGVRDAKNFKLVYEGMSTERLRALASKWNVKTKLNGKQMTRSQLLNQLRTEFLERRRKMIQTMRETEAALAGTQAALTSTIISAF